MVFIFDNYKGRRLDVKRKFLRLFFCQPPQIKNPLVGKGFFYYFGVVAAGGVSVFFGSSFFFLLKRPLSKSLVEFLILVLVLVLVLSEFDLVAFVSTPLKTSFPPFSNLSLCCLIKVVTKLVVACLMSVEIFGFLKKRNQRP